MYSFPANMLISWVWLSNAQLTSLDSKGDSVIWVNLVLKFQRSSNNSDLKGSYPKISSSLFSYWIQTVNIWRTRVEGARIYHNLSSGKTIATWCQALCASKYLRPKAYLLVVKYLRKHQNVVTSNAFHFLFLLATKHRTCPRVWARMGRLGSKQMAVT